MPAREMSVAAIVPAAGSGQRLGSGGPKALHVLGGQSLLRRSAQMLAELVDVLVVAVPADHEAEVRHDLAGLPCPVLVVVGGATRQHSVAAGLAALDTGTEFVLVHDAARPLMPPAVAVAVLAALRDGLAAVIPVIPIADTLKTLGSDGQVAAAVDRSRLVAVQTPQGFRYNVLAHAHRAGLDPLTDDAGLVEAIGVPVHTVPGDPVGFKITTPYDVVIAEALLAARS